MDALIATSAAELFDLLWGSLACHAADDHGGRGAARHCPADRPRHGAPPLPDRRQRGARRTAVPGSPRRADRDPSASARSGTSRRASFGGVFDLFVRADQSRAGSEGGLGVGLTLARTVIELHGGTIIAQSEGPGRGSEFVVCLPVGAPVEPAGPDDRRSVAIEARQILLVEDDDNVREALRRILTLDGHRVEVARDGPEGVELALATAPEVVFIDIGLPGIDGYEVGRRIRAGLGSRALLVALTAHDLEEDRRRSTHILGRGRRGA